MNNLRLYLANKKQLQMTQTEAKIAWTIRDIPFLPQNESVNYEIIDGELFVTRSPHRLHQRICVKLARYLDVWSEDSGLGETIIAPGVIFSDLDSVIPDVVWLSKAKLANIEDDAGHLLGAPELVVEVLSPGKNNETRDKEAKLKLYSLYGVREYWICDRFLNGAGDIKAAGNPQPRALANAPASLRDFEAEAFVSLMGERHSPEGAGAT